MQINAVLARTELVIYEEYSSDNCPFTLTTWFLSFHRLNVDVNVCLFRVGIGPSRICRRMKSWMPLSNQNAEAASIESTDLHLDPIWRLGPQPVLISEAHASAVPNEENLDAYSSV